MGGPPFKERGPRPACARRIYGASSPARRGNNRQKCVDWPRPERLRRASLTAPTVPPEKFGITVANKQLRFFRVFVPGAHGKPKAVGHNKGVEGEQPCANGPRERAMTIKVFRARKLLERGFWLSAETWCTYVRVTVPPRCPFPPRTERHSGCNL
ncbi:hypothetical protein SKAU_G00403440 [Synaphobranchus kaupii]|uniref:Uncharacterized protein n=1 Tax=Synaphobranchus kaupii TaxID=118154 RepID=A0A9Q1E9H6_SYNKA|nr:hypothetical protein SKAU_G00403440 [Synaphobranchus kaupii]